MTCIAPPELTDLQLSMYLDGDADAGVHSHLIRCDHCRSRAIEMASAQNEWRIALHRSSCPDSDTLRDYHFGFLTGHETGAVEEHLHWCPHCTHDLAGLRDFVSEPAREEEQFPLVADEGAGILQRIRWFVADLFQGDSEPALALAGVRGTDDEGVLVYEAGDVRIDIALRVDAAIPEQRILVGSLLGPPLEVDEEIGAWSADLWLGQEWLGTVAVDDLGSFRFSGLRPGRHELIISGHDVKMRIPSIDVE